MKTTEYVFLAAMVSLIFMLGYSIGRTDGFSKGADYHKQLKCESEFRGKPLMEVNTECLYFEN